MSCDYNKPNCTCVSQTPTTCVVHEGELPVISGIDYCNVTLDVIIGNIYKHISDIETGEGGTGGVGDVQVIDNLNSSLKNAALSANQGRILDQKKADKNSVYNKEYIDTVLQTKADKSSSLTKLEILDLLDTKVDKVAGKQLSEEDFTSQLKEQLQRLIDAGSGGGSGSTIYVIDSLTSTSKIDALSANQGYLLNKNKANKEDVVSKDEINNLLDLKVDKESNKQLSTNDFTDELKDKLDSIDAGSKLVSIIDKLDSNETTAALSANQGRVLQETKQAKLKSGENIVTINGQTLLQTGDMVLPTIPKGAIIMWGGNFMNIPDGWAICAGQSSDIPDLRGYFPVGYHPDIMDYMVPGKKGGNDMMTLDKKNLPPHTHGIQFEERAWGDNANDRPFPRLHGNSGYWAETQSAGDGEPFDNRPKFCVVIFIIKL